MNPSTAQAQVVVDELARGGVRDVVLCPGSRNAPLAFALQAADAAGRLRLHMRIDERTAGFLAIGLAVASGRPVPVVMTSGTAVANLGPAVLEANYARVPLIVLSANRPYEMLGTGANQTVEQFGLFGSQVRAAISLGLAEVEADPEYSRQNSVWRSAVCRVLAAARGTRSGNAGPVHFDIPLREPLVPDAREGDPLPAGRDSGRPWTATQYATLDVPLDIDLSPDTVVISGHGAGHRPELAALPTVAEPTAPMHGPPLHPLALSLLRPKQAIITGRPTLHRQVSRVLADPEVTVYALTTGPRWPDVSGNVVGTGTRAVTYGAPTAAWLDGCRELDERARAVIRAELAAHPKPTGLHVAAAVMDALHDGDQLLLGASNPVRDAALVSHPRPGIRVLSNRGVAGIDGTVSAAVGAALSHEGRTLALIGDLTFLHDASGLLIGPGEPRPKDLTIVVANDDGGGIFELLEQGDPQYAGVFERVFGTPHGMDLAALCAAYRVPHRQVDLSELAVELTRHAHGIRVLEVATERSSLRELHATVRAGIAD
ncbi:2-succinyl-5-enolpyruvyl-6-hydroxy-3-cyclohexene-1-carboxylic-acid synthase [Nocardia otitidiscaviarum]|uniref:2-succinyl-5-enolpyruvyl-6-hydroxy-3-cyclohexene-1-carboxylate synthase n=1 Tax=Nocardia otitidiscaviarum TaxID=1823 RepID=A0A378YB75_9NOCA|nr:2-succinyl-5-enolpyruvyl-6-hydroxy-3-cyclohexene-1-carboxylic-acid synthase [Nocardia otitidiscaviarum]MBF6137686.1 2-succinyl-5-enolpyruvyl-6-hydroxy-3-cyclohexene-1-carboxylic-acid synthase [Nocardia otitidiscaviarum]MBF6183038.1 2-succinyl-5-enolpyruvyl-6-hydroxy-3-cyclohexene-1-carboxylic-acid synthase [Nocardia otitidiscaviarum]MBF6488594.1 2-succinyl-5-enolpyruvyl-6-hydroxy-3-cyclohexene-1-carboxylic-acid synthase [Nocardia otitidiscaviarum]MCP9622645.1 2-succinyl-5-enolpyruvyl-6-hydro